MDQVHGKNGYRFDQYIVGWHHDKDDKNPHFHFMANVVLDDGTRANRINSLLLARADKIDGLLAEYQEKHPNQITAQVIADFLADKPLTREDKGKRFCRVCAGKA